MKLKAFLFLVLVGFDRVTKYCAYHWFAHGVSITSFLSFDLTFNRGVAWGMFNVADEKVFLCVSASVIVLYSFFTYFSFTKLRTTLELFGATCIIAGGISNIIDRFVYHGVVDFIHIAIGQWSWPAFNIADASITCGVLLIGYAWLTE